MITILKGKNITVEWKVVSLDTKQPVDFEGVNAKVFLLAPDNIYTLPFDVVRDDFRGLRMTIPTGYISTGVYDLKVIWLKDALKDKPVYRNVSVKREVFALTGEASEVTYDGDTIKIATGVESCGRDGLSAYEIAVFRGFAKERSEKEWVESLDDVLASEASRVEAEIKREAQENVRTETFNANERSREQSFNAAQSNRNTEFQKAETSRSNTFSANEVSRQQSFDANEDARQSTFSANEAERQAKESARVTAEGARESAEARRKQAEEARESTFAANEKSRQDTFAANESARQATFDANEAFREANETSRQNAEVIREENERRREETYQQKVDREDNAPKLTAGFANNLVGRGEATKEEISFRPSGGDTSIEDGTARIDRLKGSTVVWNQFAPTDLSTYKLLRVTNETYVDGVFTATANTANNSSYIYKNTYDIIPSKLGCIIYGVAEIKTESTNAEIYMLCAGAKYFPATGDWQKVESFGKINVWSGAVIGAGVRVKDELVTWSIRQLKYYDLTQMFGEGNEPSTIEEFHARKPLNIDEYAYNEGELISTNVEELKSVGFNALNIDGRAQYQGLITLTPTSPRELRDDVYWSGVASNGYYLKDNAEVSNISIIDGVVKGTTKGKSYGLGFPFKVLGGNVYRYTKQSEDNSVIKVTFYAADGTPIGDQSNLGIDIHTPIDCAWIMVIFYSNSANTPFSVTTPCIHLVHTGYRNGEYEPYKEFRRSIPIKDIKDKDGNQLFPNGLLSAGSVYDEITATKAIKRIGVRVYQDGDMWTDGVTTYYELAEPIEVDLPEPLNLDYEVSDFGTEEVISDAPTTPMKADVIYQFNAVDRIRDNSRHTAEAEIKLKDYETRMAALEAIVASLTSSDS